MAAGEESSVPVIAVTAAVGAVVLLLVLLCGIGKKGNKKEEEEEEKREQVNGTVKTVKQPIQKKEKAQLKKKEAKHSFSHQWLASTLKGHGSPVLGLAFSPNGKYLASTAQDRTILVWTVKEFNQKEHRSVRANVELDNAIKIHFSPDSKAFIVNLFNANTIRVFKMGKKEDGSLGNIQGAFDFPEKAHDFDIINIGLSMNGKFIMTCSKDTCIKVWDLRGTLLSTIETHQVNNSYGAVSPCGRFVASSGFTPDVKVWEVCFDKSGGFQEVSRAFELKGHTAGVYCFSFSAGSERMATLSKDGTWKLWDTNVEYQKRQDPYLLQTGKYDHSGPGIISLSPDGRTVAIAHGSDISVYNANTAECAQTLQSVHAGPVVALEFDISSRYLVAAGDKHIHVIHNVVGYQATIKDLEEKKRKATTAGLRERLNEQIEEARSTLKKLGVAQ